jgi:hypothetical protein
VDRCELAWAAGFFDGEGWAGFERQAGRSTSQPHARVNQADNAGTPFVLARFKHALGGLGAIGGPYTKPGRMDLYRWEVSSLRDVQALLELLSPWLADIKLSQLAAASRSAKPAQHRTADQYEQCAWAAGLFDGEGSMSLLRHGTHDGYFVGEMSVTQLGATEQPEVLRRFIEIVDAGKLYGPYSQNRTHGAVYRWKCHTLAEFVEVRTRLAPWLSAVKTAQVQGAMSVLLAQPRLPRGNPEWGRDKTHCINGHAYAGARIRPYVARKADGPHRRGRGCLECLREYASRRRQKKRPTIDDDRRSFRAWAALLVEVGLVHLDVALPFVRDGILGKDRADRAHRLTCTTVDALVGVDEVHIVRVGRIYAVDRTDIHTACVLESNAWLGDHVGHRVTSSQ